MNPYEAPTTTNECRRKGLPLLFKAVWVVFTLCFVPASAWCAGVFVWTHGYNRIGLERLAMRTTLAVTLSGLAAMIFCLVVLVCARRRTKLS